MGGRHFRNAGTLTYWTHWPSRWSHTGRWLVCARARFVATNSATEGRGVFIREVCKGDDADFNLPIVVSRGCPYSLPRSSWRPPWPRARGTNDWPLKDAFPNAFLHRHGRLRRPCRRRKMGHLQAW